MPSPEASANRSRTHHRSQRRADGEDAAARLPAPRPHIVVTVTNRLISPRPDCGAVRSRYRRAGRTTVAARSRPIRRIRLSSRPYASASRGSRFAESAAELSGQKLPPALPRKRWLFQSLNAACLSRRRIERVRFAGRNESRRCGETVWTECVNLNRLYRDGRRLRPVVDPRRLARQ
jgi:hypothetical protein